MSSDSASEQPDLFAALPAELTESPISKESDGTHVIVGEVVSFRTFEDSGFTVGTIRSAETSASERFVGHNLPGIAEGAFVHFRGIWEDGPGGKRQFQVRRVVSRLPLEEDAAIRYLMANVSGCGVKTAEEIARRLGPACVQILAFDPERVEAVFPPGKKRENLRIAVREWSTTYQENLAAEEVHERLMGVGITLNLARRIVRTLGAEEAHAATLYRPYTLVQVPGIGFRTADEIARGLGISSDDPARVSAGVLHALEQAMTDGDSALPRKLLVRRARHALQLKTESGRLVEVTREAVAQAINDALSSGHVVEYEGLLYRSYVDRLEQKVAELLSHLARRREKLTSLQQATLEVVIGKAGLAPEQADAVRRAFQSGLFVLTGRPGSGKTTTLKTFLDGCEAMGWGEEVLVAAPTGKAASRASEVIGRPAKTIHRLMGVPFGVPRPAPLSSRFVVLDESSMCDLAITGWLLENLDLDRTSLILVGDANQLPSVGHGQVLSDLLQCDTIPSASLLRIFRQKEGSLITTNAHRVLDRTPLDVSNPEGGDFYFLDVTEKSSLGENGFVEDDAERSKRESEAARLKLVACIERFRDHYGADPVRDIQVLSPMRKNLLGVLQLNLLVQDIVNPRGEIGPMIGDGARVRVGDRVIQAKNDYNLGVFNGDQGEVVAVDNSRLEVRVRFADEEHTLGKKQLRNIQLSWVISVHRSQGSEFPYVIMMYHTSHHIMLSRSLLYTGITRARSKFCLIGNQRALSLTFQRGQYAEQRYTGLAHRIRGCLQEIT